MRRALLAVGFGVAVAVAMLVVLLLIIVLASLLLAAAQPLTALLESVLGHPVDPAVSALLLVGAACAGIVAAIWGYNL